MAAFHMPTGRVGSGAGGLVDNLQGYLKGVLQWLQGSLP